jgi:hypothetical protein
VARCETCHHSQEIPLTGGLRCALLRAGVLRTHRCGDYTYEPGTNE